MVMGYNRWIVYNEVPVQGEKLDQIYVTRCKRTWSITVPPPKWPSFHGPEWFVINCVRCLIPKDSGVLLIFYEFFQLSSKPLPNKQTQSNIDFTFLRGSFKINVN
jgi:hypothetical protein